MEELCERGADGGGDAKGEASVGGLVGRADVGGVGGVNGTGEVVEAKPASSSAVEASPATKAEIEAGRGSTSTSAAIGSRPVPSSEELP